MNNDKIFIYFIFLFFFLNFWNFMYLMILIYLIIMIYFYPSFFSLTFNNLFFFDNLNYLLILLTLWIIFLMVMSMNLIKFNYNYFKLMIFMLYFMTMFLLFSFSIFNYLFFYIFFEMSLIPILYLVLGWGYQPERILAGLYLLFYTLLASLPLLLGIMFMLNFLKSLIMYNFYFLIFNKLVYFSLIMAFLVKMPMFMVHLWLPKAHVEAPISGSMILAAILLKLGGYGLLRVFFFLLKFKNLNLFFMILSIFGGILISLNCLRQLDLKMLIAYSSVAHMGLVLGGLFTLTYWGVSGSFLMMIAHGLCSSGLFCLANISYERMMSRSLLINKGLMNFMPSMALWWFLLSSSNMSAPLSLNLISEIKLINSVLSWSLINMYLLMFLCFFSASYSYYLYAYSQHGLFYSSIFSFSNNNQREFMLVFFHWFPLNILFLKVLIYF